jgi:hypothetical protein
LVTIVIIIFSIAYISDRIDLSTHMSNISGLKNG